MTTPFAWQRLEAIFDGALERPAAERAAFVARECAGDDELRREVEALLRADADAATPLDERTFSDHVATLLATPPELGMAGPYRLLEQIGEGGSSGVYLAERADDAYRQRVAVKMLRRSLDSEVARARFRRERQILAELDHPAIARLLDGGTTAEGVAFLVMELVEGRPIQRFCDEETLPLENRLRLFLRVLDAVQYAHQRLVVHRDLKPANILVRNDGLPKLLDFGIAKLLDEESENTTAYLAFTPSHASPEQVLGEPITTATDVYALGVVLYRLLTGKPPYQVDPGAVASLVRTVTREEPPPPSRVAPGQERALRGDLDAIVLKALAKKPADRYPTASALAADLERHTRGLPVEARAAGWGYRAAKWLRRHRWRVAAGFAAAAALALFSLNALDQARRTREALGRAEAERDKAQAVNVFLLDLLTLADPASGERRDLPLIEAVRQADAAIGADLARHPELEAAVRHAVGATYAALNEQDAADAMLRRAIELRRSLIPPGTRAEAEVLPLVQSLTVLARSRREANQLDEAEALIGEARQLADRHLASGGKDAAEVLAVQGGIERDRGRREEAARIFEEALARLRAPGVDQPRALAMALNNLATLRSEQDRWKDAAALFEEAGRNAEIAFGERHPINGTIRVNLGLARLQTGDAPGAEAAVSGALAIQRQLYGENHPRVASALQVLGNIASARGDDTLAERHHRAALAIRERTLAADHPNVAVSLNAVARILARTERYGEAETLARRAIAITEARYGKNTERVLQGYDVLAQTLEGQGKKAEAAAMLRRLLAARREEYGESSMSAGYARGRLAGLLQNLGPARRQEALALFQEAAATLRAAGDKGRGLASFEMGALRCQIELGQLDDAEKSARAVLEGHAKLLGVDRDLRESFLRRVESIGRPGLRAEVERALASGPGETRPQ